MAYFQVTAAELKQKAEELNGLNQRFMTETESLVNAQNALKSTWEGEANDSFTREFLKDKAFLENFQNAVSQYIEALNLISAKYEEVENRNLSLAGNRTY